jgi:hypothetical protein
MLGQAVTKDLGRLIPELSDPLPVLIRVYANMNALSKAYIRAGILNKATFDDFARGFNSADIRCEYVDTGTNKEHYPGKVLGMNITAPHALHRILD